MAAPTGVWGDEKGVVLLGPGEYLVTDATEEEVVEQTGLVYSVAAGGESEAVCSPKRDVRGPR